MTRAYATRTEKSFLDTVFTIEDVDPIYIQHSFMKPHVQEAPKEKTLTEKLGIWKKNFSDEVFYRY